MLWLCQRTENLWNKHKAMSKTIWPWGRRSTLYVIMNVHDISSLGDGPKPVSKQKKLQTAHESAQKDGQMDGHRWQTTDRVIPIYPTELPSRGYNLVLYLKRSNLFSKGLSLVCIGKGNITTCLHYSEMSHRKQIKQMLYILIEYNGFFQLFRII